MGSQIYFQNPQPICHTQTRNFTLLSSVSSLHTKHNKTKKLNIFASSTNTATQTQDSETDFEYNVKFQTLGGCKLGISRYPDFEYNAEGGSGTGKGTKIIENNDDLKGEIWVDFDVKTLYIPPLMSSTTRFLGLALPPFLKIDIVPEILQGRINQVTGKVELEFKAKFWFSVGKIYKAPPLMVETVLTSEDSEGNIRSGRGTRLDGDNGRCTLVGVATVQPINDLFMDSFLSLPTECLANLNAIITFTTT